MIGRDASTTGEDGSGCREPARGDASCPETLLAALPRCDDTGGGYARVTATRHIRGTWLARRYGSRLRRRQNARVVHRLRDREGGAPSLRQIRQRTAPPPTPTSIPETREPIPITYLPASANPFPVHRGPSAGRSCVSTRKNTNSAFIGVRSYCAFSSN